MPNVDVSVVVAHRDDPVRLVRALDSIAAQTYAVCEVLVVDDASDPERRIAAQEAVDRFPGATLIPLSINQGPATARNAGWDRARGAWVAFLDSDEVWHEQKIARQVVALSAAPRLPTLVASRVVQLRPSDVPAQFTGSALPGSSGAVAHLARRHLLVRNPFPTSSVMVRRDLPIRFTAGMRHCEDYDLWLRMAGDGGLMLKVDAPLVARFKFPFGHSGLSGDVRAMMHGEVESFARARRRGDLTLAEWAFATSVMGVRFVRQSLLHKRRSRRGYPTA